MSHPELYNEKKESLKWNPVWDTRSGEEWKTAGSVGSWTLLRVCLVRSIAQDRIHFFKKNIHQAKREMFDVHNPNLVDLVVSHGHAEILEYLLLLYPESTREKIGSWSLRWPIRFGHVHILMILVEFVKVDNWMPFLELAVDCEQAGIIEVIMGWNSKNENVSLARAIRGSMLTTIRFTPISEIKDFLVKKRDEFTRFFKTDKEKEWFQKGCESRDFQLAV